MAGWGIEEIAALAKARGLDGVAICDHDVVYTPALRRWMGC